MITAESTTARQRTPHVTAREAARLARETGVRDIPLVASYLILCDGPADANRSLQQLRRNRPQLFRGAPRGK